MLKLDSIAKNPSQPCLLRGKSVIFAVALEPVRQFGFTQCRYADSLRRAES